MPTATTETINFADLKALLLSKDMKKYTLLEQMTQGGKCLFLDGAVDLQQQKDAVAFCSFVRMGNSFLRVYLEKITGVFTGADMSMERTFFDGQMGLLG